MKNFIYILLSFLAVSVAVYGRINLSGNMAFGVLFVSGLFLGIFLMNLKINVKNDRINCYKRELEKESVQSLESASRVKILESKIEVLEKALENALKKD